jgi:hypothetical protein
VIEEKESIERVSGLREGALVVLRSAFGALALLSIAIWSAVLISSPNAINDLRASKCKITSKQVMSALICCLTVPASCFGQSDDI